MFGTQGEREGAESGSGSRPRNSRFNSEDSRRKSTGFHRFQEPGNTLHHEDAINVYERQTRGSSPQTRKLSSKSRHSGSNATSPPDRIQLSGSAAAPLRVLKPKLVQTSSQRKGREGTSNSKLNSIELDRANYSITHHGLFHSLDSDKVMVCKEAADTSKQFESIEPGRIRQSLDR